MHPSDPAHRPPGFFRVLQLLLRLSFRRTFNAVTTGLDREGRKKGPAGERQAGPRKATGRRKRSGWFWLLVIFVIFQLNGVQMSCGYLQKLCLQLGIESSGQTDHYLVDSDRFAHWLETDLEDLRELEAKGDPTGKGIETVQASAMQVFRRVLRPLDDWLTPGERAEHLARMDRLWRSGDDRWLVPVSDFPIPAPGVFGFPGVGEPLARGVTLLLIYLVICLVFIDLGMKNTDLGSVEGDLVWLHTFPVPSWTLFAARLFQYTIATVFGWFVFLPLLLTCAWTAHRLTVALPLALLGTLYLNFTVACGRFLGETWLRQRFSVRILKNLQGLFTLIGVIGLFAQLYMLNEGVPRAGILRLLESAHDPGSNPAGWPLVLVLGSPATAWIAACMALFTLALGAVTLTILSRLVKRGLLRQSGTYRGVRTPGKRDAVTRVTGVLSKELRLLMRDRNLLVQTVILPILLLGLQFSFVEDLMEILTKLPSRLATAAFSVGTYGLASSSMASLAIEQRALWILFTLPVPIEQVLFRKAALWGAVAATLTTGVIGIGLFHAGIPGPEGILELVLAVIGILLFALIGTCLGALGTDPFEPEVRLRLDPAKVKIFMYLMASHAAILLVQSIGAKVAMTLLLGAFAYALVQDLRREIPYLLEPVEGPPPIITLSDGIYCVLGFFVSQQLISLFLIHAFDMENLGLVLNASFGASGLLVFLLSRSSFWRRGVTDLPTFWPRDEARSFGGLMRGVPVGLFYGLSAGLVGIGYMITLMNTHPVLWVESQKTALDPGNPWFLVLAILAAPLFEEYIFRGLVMRGLEASVSPRHAVFGSALLFALVHPTLSFFPVLALGIGTALAYQRSRSLAAAMVTHAVYNALVVTVQAGLI